MKAYVKYGTVLSIVAALAACHGGSTSTTPVASISGLAATGNALANATVNAKCTSGSALTGTTSATGTFTLPISGQVMPCIVQVTNGTITLNGFATAAGHINVTPFTDLIITKALDTDSGTTFTNFNATTGAALVAGIANAKAFVAAEITPLVGTAPTANPLTDVFQIGDVNDKLLDALGAALTASGKTIADLRTAAANGASLAAVLLPEETRPHDTSAYPYAVSAADAIATTFPAFPAASGDVVDMSTTSRWAGVLHGAAYHVEVPANWNGKLVMYAHGYAGEGLTLSVTDVPIRRHLIQAGYAWAASSYSKNSYDVRAGVEDTNALALAFNKIAALNARPLAVPSKVYIIGHSMGGHVTAAAVEDETYATANNKMKYNAALPMCGVVGDRELFNTFAAEQMAAQTLTGYASNPYFSWSTIKSNVFTTLLPGFPFSAWAPSAPLGTQYQSVVQNLTGGARPIFDIGFLQGGSFIYPYFYFGVNPVDLGILTKQVYDTNEYNGPNATLPYTVDGDATTSLAINTGAQIVTADPLVNPLRRDGLRWIPLVNGQFHVPVLTMHTLGDLFVPFRMEQVYRKRAVAQGTQANLVQRAIRGAKHCDFTIAEQVAGFDAMVNWESNNVVPGGDDVLTPSAVAASTYGCTYTNNTIGPDDDSSVGSLRQTIIAAHPC